VLSFGAVGYSITSKVIVAASNSASTYTLYEKIEETSYGIKNSCVN
jgi:hypothetical protein